MSKWAMLAGAFALAAIAAVSTSRADPAEVTTLSKNTGADRDSQLAAAARKEGQVEVYSSLVPKDLMTLAGAFEKKYGVKVVFWRAGSEKVLQRALTEARAGRREADVVETNGPELEALAEEKVLAPVTCAHEKDLLPAALRPDKRWTGLRLNLFVQAYNTNLVKKQDLPKTYEDLLDPKWKGKLAMEAQDLDWFAAVVTGMGEQKGLDFFRKLVTTNGIELRKGHTLLAGLVAAGEIPLTLTLYNHNAEKLQRKGAPIQWFMIEPAYARVNGLGVTAAAPHPHAALLFFDYMLGPEGQRILQKAEYIPVNLKVDDPRRRPNLRFIDPAMVVHEEAKWNKLYDAIITRQGR